VKILGCDPGPEKSSFVFWDSQAEKILQGAILPNSEVLGLFRSLPSDCEAVVIEMISHYGSGMPAGKEVFNTCVFIGELKEACAHRFKAGLIERRHIKIHFCNSARAKDANIRQALIDRFGSPGTKKVPGRLYGVKADEWQALGLAVFWGDLCATPQIEAFQNSAEALKCFRTRDLLSDRGKLPENRGPNGEKEDSDGRGKGRAEKASNCEKENGGGLRSNLRGDPGEPSSPYLLVEGRG